ncbi:DUF742 domain-containing protein [Nonomuraea sp. NBC_01738]|uniref:DUF742 domain-containing protein n=1 Tax=Nonomuraea sp. NBC_01738 TaxID=2976003 RepID=UPI002E13EB58|nr:DUF742 domain-containing protein [Nonomuraea sp. NBC_01738]
MSGQGGGDYRDSAVRPYVLTQGRARPTRNTIGLDTLLVVADPQKPLPISASRQERALLRMCRRLLSLAEAAAHLDLPLSVATILASDLVDSGHLTARSRIPEVARPSHETLKEVLDGLRRLR